MEAYPARGLGMRVGKGDSERVWGQAADREGASGKIGAKTVFSYLVKQEARRRDPLAAARKTRMRVFLAPQLLGKRTRHPPS